jgi:TRAP-type C4-dicarboxylate transport system permease small subunit
VTRPINRVARALVPVFGGVSRLVMWFAASGLLAMTLIVGWHVFARRVLNDTPHWSETGSVLIMFWYSLLGAAIGVRYRMHIGLVIIRNALPPRIKLALMLFAHAVVAVFGTALVVYGTRMVETTWNQTIPTVGLPTGLRYLPFPIAGVLMVVFAAELVVRDLAGEEDLGEWS